MRQIHAHGSVLSMLCALVCACGATDQNPTSSGTGGSGGAATGTTSAGAHSGGAVSGGAMAGGAMAGGGGQAAGRVDTLPEYLLVSPTARRIELWSRDSTSDTRSYAVYGPGDLVDLRSITCRLDVNELYLAAGFAN